jgi:hypothetical protein
MELYLSKKYSEFVEKLEDQMNRLTNTCSFRFNANKSIMYYNNQFYIFSITETEIGIYFHDALNINNTHSITHILKDQIEQSSFDFSDLFLRLRNLFLNKIRNLIYDYIVLEDFYLPLATIFSMRSCDPEKIVKVQDCDLPSKIYDFMLENGYNKEHIKLTVNKKGTRWNLTYKDRGFLYFVKNDTNMAIQVISKPLFYLPFSNEVILDFVLSAIEIRIDGLDYQNKLQQIFMYEEVYNLYANYADSTEKTPEE